MNAFYAFVDLQHTHLHVSFYLGSSCTGYSLAAVDSFGAKLLVWPGHPLERDGQGTFISCTLIITPMRQLKLDILVISSNARGVKHERPCVVTPH